MEKIIHQYHNGHSLYEMVIEKIEITGAYVLGYNGELIKCKHHQSAVTPSRGTFYLITDNEKRDITETIDEHLKTEILENFRDKHQSLI